MRNKYKEPENKEIIIGEDGMPIDDGRPAVIPFTKPVVAIVLAAGLLGAGISALMGFSWNFWVQSFLFFGVLAYIALVDIKLKLVSNWIHPIIMVLGLLNFITRFTLPTGLSMVAGLLIVPLPLLLVLLFTKKSGVGGGDIKLMGAVGFLLGFNRAYFALLIGLALFIVIAGIKIKTSKLDKRHPFALVPFLAIGCMIAYFL